MPHKQQQFRRLHTENELSGKHAAHTLPVEIHAYINSLITGPAAYQNVVACNRHDNLVLVEQRVNQSDHKKIDNEILDAMRSSTIMTLCLEATERAKEQIDIVRTGEYTAAFKLKYKEKMSYVRGADGKLLLHGNTKL